jgi:predicted nucleic acid-binding protein
MTRYVIGPDVAIRLAHDQAVIRGGHQVLAPALLRSQVLSLLYQAVRRGEMTRKDAEQHLEYMRGLRIRLLGDRVLQNVAWKAAVLLGWPDTFDAEYVALTQLHADALITLDRHLADAVKDLVTIAPIEALYGPKPALRAALPRELLICRIEGVVVAHIYPRIGILTHDFPALRGLPSSIFYRSGRKSDRRIGTCIHAT